MWNKIHNWLFPPLKKGDLVPWTGGMWSNGARPIKGHIYQFKVGSRYYFAEYVGFFILAEYLPQHTFKIISPYQQEESPKEVVRNASSLPDLPVEPMLVEPKDE